MKSPDPKLHLVFSLAKSLIRLLGYLCLIGGPMDGRWLITGALVLCISELLGVMEELV